MSDVLLLVAFALALFFAGVGVGMRLILNWLGRTNLTINCNGPKLTFVEKDDPA